MTLRNTWQLKIKLFYKQVKELDDLMPALPCLKDQPDGLTKVEQENVLTTPFAMYGLLMCNFYVQTEEKIQLPTQSSANKSQEIGQTVNQNRDKARLCL